VQQILKEKDSNYYMLSIFSDHTEMFVDDDDFSQFLECLNNVFIKCDQADVVAYCLRKTSIEILYLLNIKSSLDDEIKQMFKNYNNYFLKKNHYGLGNIIESFKNYQVTEDELISISKKLHTSPKKWCDYEKSSARAYLYGDNQIELDKTPISKRFMGVIDYYNYLKE
jgi:hypothetical protein